MFPKERNDHVQQVDPPSDNVPVHVFAVIVDTSVAKYSSDTKELPEVR